MKCPEERKVQCPAFTKQRGGDCWQVERTLCRGELQGTMAQKMGSCRKCDFYLGKNSMGMNLRKKLLLSFAVVLILLAVVSGITVFEKKKISASYDTLIEGRGQVALKAKEVTILFQENAISFRTYLLTGQSDYAERYQGNLSRLEQEFKDLANMLRTEEGKRRFEQFYAKYQEFTKYADGAIKLKEASLKDPSKDYTLEINTYLDSNKGIVRQVTEEGKQLSNFAAELMSAGHRENKSQAAAVIGTSIVITILAVLLGIGIAFYMARLIANPLKALEANASRVAAGDLTVDEVNIKNRDEIGLLAAAFNQMVGSLRDIALQLKEKSRQVAASAQELTSNSEQMTSVTMENGSTVSELAAAVDNVASDAQRVAAASDSAVKLAEEGTRAVEKVNSQMQVISNSTHVETVVLITRNI